MEMEAKSLSYKMLNKMNKHFISVCSTVTPSTSEVPFPTSMSVFFTSYRQQDTPLKYYHIDPKCGCALFLVSCAAQDIRKKYSLAISSAAKSDLQKLTSININSAVQCYLNI